MSIYAIADDAANRRGALAMLGAMACFVCNDTLVKLATAAYPTGQVLAVRGVFASLAALGLALALSPARDLSGLRDPLVVTRALLECLVALTFIVALAHMPLGNITAIIQAATLVVVALAALTGIESVGWRRWAAVVVGFLGVLLVVKPTADGFNIYSILAVICALLCGVRDVLTRRIRARTSSGVVALATTVFVTVTGFVYGLAENWTPLRLSETLYLACAALLVVIGNYLIIVAFRVGDPSLIAGLRYTVLVYAMLLGFAVWGEVPDALSLLGAVLIVLSGIYALYRQRVRGQGPPPIPAPPA